CSGHIGFLPALVLLLFYQEFYSALLLGQSIAGKMFFILPMATFGLLLYLSGLSLCYGDSFLVISILCFFSKIIYFVNVLRMDKKKNSLKHSLNLLRLNR